MGHCPGVETRRQPDARSSRRISAINWKRCLASGGFGPFGGGNGNGAGGGGNGSGPPPGCTSDTGSDCSPEPSLPCWFQAVGKNGLTVGFDLLGFIPGEGVAATGVKVGAALAGSANSLIAGDTDTEKAVGSVGNIIGAQFALLGYRGYAELGRAVPIAGTVLNLGLLIYDVAHTVGDYGKCTNSPTGLYD